MAKDVLTRLILLAVYVASVGSTHSYCACIRQEKKHLHVYYCTRCNFDYGDDYRWPGDPEDNRLYTPQNGSLLEAVRNTVKRRVGSHGSCPGLFYEFTDDGQMCSWLNSIDKRKKTPTSRPTTDSLKTTTLTTNKKTAVTDVTTTTSDSGEAKRRKQDDQDDDDKENSKKDTNTNANVDNQAGAVTAGVAVALSILFFLLGLLTMWLILKFCTKGVLQNIRRRFTREEEKTTPGLSNTCTTSTSNQHVNYTRAHERDVTVPVPEVARPDSSHRTSYEGLRPENRTDNVYNALDPDYQSHEQPNTASPGHAGVEYFVLEKTNNDIVNEINDKKSPEKPVSPTHTAADYFVLEKENTDTNYSQIKDKEIDFASDNTQTVHNYFLLEKEESAHGSMKDENPRNEPGNKDNAAHNYFILEKETDYKGPNNS